MNVAIVGVSGAVGQEFLRVLAERPFKIDRLELFASARSAGKTITFKGKDYVVRELKHGDDFKDIDIAFVSAGGSVSLEYADTITKYGAVMIDNSSAFRMEDDVPLVVPEVNASDALVRPRGIIANPNCTTIQMVVALQVVEQLSHITHVHVSTYQAASGAGATGMLELDEQTRQIARGEEPTVEKFAYQLAYNLIPHIDVFTDNDYTKEEMKMYHETRKIMHSDISVSATCVRVPVTRAHSENIWLETEQELDIDSVREAFRRANGVVLQDVPTEKIYPMPLYVAEKDPVYIGRLRRDISNPKGITFWCVADQIKKGNSPLALMQWCEEFEKRSFIAANRSLRAPAQRMTDFLAGRISSDLPSTSYNMGLTPSKMTEWMPSFVTTRLMQGFKAFDRMTPGFITEEAQLIGVESRTSSPVRIPRDRESYLHLEIGGLYPAGEGAGYAGGIVSAAIDGENAATALASVLLGSSRG